MKGLNGINGKVSFGVGVAAVPMSLVNSGQIPAELKKHIEFTKDLDSVMAKHGKDNMDMLHVNAERALGALVESTVGGNTQGMKELTELVFEDANEIVKGAIELAEGNPAIALVTAINAAMLLSNAVHKMAQDLGIRPGVNAMGLDDLNDLGGAKATKKTYGVDDVLGMTVGDLLDALNKK